MSFAQKLMGKWIILLMVIIGVVFLMGCRKERVNLSAMAPDDQFEYAKGIFDKKDYYKAKMQFTIIVLNNPGHQVIEKAQYYLGESYYYEKEYLLAVEEYEKLIRSLPQSPYVDDARYKVGMCYYKLAPGYALDQENNYKAIAQFQQFLEEYPQSDRRPQVEKQLAECTERLAEKEFKTGDLYRKMSYFRAAIFSFDAVLERHFDTKFADDALYLKGECHKKIGEWDEAEKAFQDLMAKHAESEWVKKAGEKLAEVREKREKEQTNTEEESSRR